MTAPVLIADRHPNNFDILRLAGALLVALGHAMDVFIGHDWLAQKTNVQSFGGLGLLTFCVISGYLITQSRLRNTAADFAWSRALRILPALLVAIPLMAFVAGPLITTLPVSAYFRSGQTWRFLATVFIFPLNSTLPGVFNGTPLAGQLYSLTAEVTFYIFVGFLGQWKHFPVLAEILLTALLSFLIASNYTVLPFTTIVNVEVGSLSLFTFPVRLGSLCLFYLLMGSVMANLSIPKRLLTRFILPFLALWLVALTAQDRRAYDMVEMILFPAIVLGIGLNERFTIRIPNFIGDISYGTYIYHFIVAELLFTLVAPASLTPLRSAVGVALSVVLSAAIGWFSFQLVEKRALRFKPARAKRAVAEVSVAARAAGDFQPIPGGSVDC